MKTIYMNRRPGVLDRALAAREEKKAGRELQLVQAKIPKPVADRARAVLVRQGLSWTDLVRAACDDLIASDPGPIENEAKEEPVREGGEP